MDNPRLLTGLLVAVLSGGGVCAAGQEHPTVITLEDLFETAEHRSAQLQPAFSEQRRAALQLDEARAARLPDINTSLNLSYIGNGFTTRRNFSDYEKAPIPHFGSGLSVNVTQPVYAGGAITAGIELAELKLTAARYATELRRDNIRFQLTGFYLDIYKYANLRSVVRNNLEQARKVLDEMNARHVQGTVLRNDITRYELLVSDLELQLTKIDNTSSILNDNLVTLAGLPRGTSVLPDTSLLERSLPTATEASWLSEAAQLSPAIALARSKVEMSRKSETLAKAALRPKIDLSAGWSIDGPILVEIPPINRNLSYWFAGINITYSLSALYKANRTVASSRSATALAADELAATRENVELSLRTDYIRYLEAYEELKTRRKGVELAERNYTVTSTRYAAGMALITDMLDAANSRLDAELRLVNARIDIIYYYYKLLFTSGKI